jgi:lipopolysaccharide/colanic/teichoic acid biosynthesis glycosyltransferase
MLKRNFDIICSFLAVLVFTPIFIILAIMIKLLTPGPVFFIQKRVGKNGRLFDLYKFRTMSPSKYSKDGSFDAGDNSRVTPLGKLLRKYKLDELPQLINVFKGDMSFVGPRPEVLKWTQVYTEKWNIVHSVRPGITDYASIYFRNEEEILANSNDPLSTYREVILPKKLDLYISYIQNRTFFLDMRIIFLTIKAIFAK